MDRILRFVNALILILLLLNIIISDERVYPFLSNDLSFAVCLQGPTMR